MTLTLETPDETAFHGRIGDGPKPDVGSIRRGLTLNQGLVDWRAAMQSTEWRPVVGYEGLYEVSDDGRVRNAHGHVLKPAITADGYLRVCLTKNHREKNAVIHRLVAFAFHGDPLPGQEVCHNDGNPANDRADNLRWDTRSSNQFDSIAQGTHAKARRTHCPHGHEFTPENTYVIPGRRARRCQTCTRERKRLARLSKPTPVTPTENGENTHE